MTRLTVSRAKAVTPKRSHFALGVIAGLTGVAALTPAVRAAEYSWKWGVDQALDHPYSVRAIQAFERIRHETNGQLDIKAFPNSTLGNDTSMTAQLRAGDLEMQAHATGTLDTLVPVASITNIGFAFANRESAYAAMDGDLGTMIRRAILDKGVMCLDKVCESGMRHFGTNTHPVRTDADLAGMKLRTAPGRLPVDTFRTLGASVTPIDPSLVYSSLQTHIVDGLEINLFAFSYSRYSEVVKYFSLVNHSWSCYVQLINQQKWDSLGPKLQTVLRDNFNSAVLLERRDYLLQEQVIIDKLKRQGLTVTTIADRSSFRDKLVAGGYYGRWRETYGTAAWATLEKYAGRLS